MLKNNIKIRSSEGPKFDCYVVTPETEQKVPAVVLASAIHGVDKDLREIADEFASRGYIAAAPDLFWRTVPGPLVRDDPRSAPRGQPRLEKIKAGERDLADVLLVLRKLSLCNGRTAVIGFCYGGPYAILGPKRLGYDAGIACHGSQMLDFIEELDGVRQPLCIMWGDQDHAAPAHVLEAYRAVPARLQNVEVHVFAGVQHGYMMHGNTTAFDQKTYDFSVERALAILEGLRKTPSQSRIASAQRSAGR
jgi:carboxymethylenebutenolidase